MTKISVYKKGSHIAGYVVEGHTGYAEEGSDIVCAAVSTVATHTLNGLTEVVKIPVGYEVRDAYLECIVPDNLSEEAKNTFSIIDILTIEKVFLQNLYFYTNCCF